MFMNNNKRKKHPILAMAVGGLAIFGAYSMVCCAKNTALACKDKMTNLMSGKKRGKCAPDLTTMMQDCED